MRLGRFPILLLVFLCALPADAGTPFFRVAEEAGKWWFTAPPDGRRFYSMGIDCVVPGDWSPDPGSPKYRGADVRGGEEAWSAFEAGRLKSWGFNTVGAWSARSMERRGIPYVACIWIGVGAQHRLVDVWDPWYGRRVEEEAEKQLKARLATDPDLIGYFIDNELPWWGGAPWRSGGGTLLDLYLGLTRTAPGRIKAEALKGRGADEFAGEVARRFLALTTAAIRKRDPNHLILGVRFAADAPGPVVRAVGEACDVVSVNWYVKDGRPDPGHLRRMYRLARKPILITEFSYRAMENRTGTRNTRGADVTVPAQADRAERYTRYVEALAQLPEVVGFHWFQWADQPARGRFDGEDCNYGLVDYEDEPYEPLRGAMAAMNGCVGSVHAESPIALGVPADRRLAPPPLPVAAATIPFIGLTWADYGKMPASAPLAGTTWGDAKSECGCRFEREDGEAVFSFTAGPGWGCGVTLGGPSSGRVDVAGATRLVVEAQATKGLRFGLLVGEDGVGPREAASFTGSRGADGEQYTSGDLEGTGTARTYFVDLSGLRLSGGYGNPSGDARLDTPALARVEVRVGGGQGAGEIRLFRVGFE